MNMATGLTADVHRVGRPRSDRGPRRSEAAGLCWEDIDLAAGKPTIREQVIVVFGVEHPGPPKSVAEGPHIALLR